MKLVERQPESVQLVVKPVVQLCAMLSSQDSSARIKAVNIIKTLRKKPAKKIRMKLLQGIRKQKVPELQWGSESWLEMINWKTATVSEPYILERLTMKQVEEALDTPLFLPKFPLHSQSDERAVELVSEASSQVRHLAMYKYLYCTMQVCGAEARHNCIITVNRCRQQRQAYSSKSYYKNDL